MAKQVYRKRKRDNRKGNKMTTQRDMLVRAKDAAKDYLDANSDFQAALKANTYESWEKYLGELSDCEDNASEEAHIQADSWDTVIYTYKALAIVSDVDGYTLDNAEEQMTDCGFTFESFGQTVTTLAYWIVYNAVYDAIMEQIEELRELAAAQQENALESEES